MNIHELRAACLPLMRCNSIKDCDELLKIYSSFFFKTLQKHQQDEVDTTANAQAKIILQMMLTKVLHLRSVIAGIHYIGEDGTELKEIIDPTSLAVLIRNVYETVGMFNLIYRSTTTPDEKLILYNLWVHAGLSYRQRFAAVATSGENKKKAEEEKQLMEQLVNEIKATALYKDLNEKNQNKILQKIKDKDYLIKFDGKEVIFLHWQDLTTLLGIENLLDKIYTYFSLYSHPSNVSVFQFADMFAKTSPEFIPITTFNLKTLFVFVSCFIADYINLFPKVLATYNELPLVHQIAINFHNKYARGNKYSINDSFKQLG